MMNDRVRAFNWQLGLLQALIWFKRSLRLLIRSIWFGVTGYLLAWELNISRGMFPDEKNWLWLGVISALIPFIVIFFSWPKKKRLAWLLDRKFGLHEQISTALNKVNETRENIVLLALFDDVLEILPKIRRRLVFRGWHISRDLLALMIVMILFAGVYVYHYMPASIQTLDAVDVSMLPPLGNEANASDIFPAGPLGLKPTPTPVPDNSQGLTGSNTGVEAQAAYQSATDALSNMGKQLSQTAATHDLGSALLSGDMSLAASAMEDLADNLENLDSATIRMLSEAMFSTAGSMSSNLNEVQKLSEDLMQASSDLQELIGEKIAEEHQASTIESRSQTELATKDAMDQVANDLQSFGEQEAEAAGIQGGDAGPKSENGGVEPAIRIEGEGEVFNLDTTGAGQPSILNPPATETTGDQATNSERNLIINEGGNFIKTPLIPSFYPWKWRNVVSTYFLSR
jgi:hypothetical protein